MSSDFQMTPLCCGCGGAEDLYGNNSICLACGITGLIMELDISKDDTCSSSRTNVAANDTPSPSPGLLNGPITEDEIRAVLLSCTNVTCVDLVTMFKPRLRSREQLYSSLGSWDVDGLFHGRNHKHPNDLSILILFLKYPPV